MAYITNDGTRLIERARTEGKSIVFGSVRMNTIYKSDPYSLVQQTDEWFGENHGSVVGCNSHVSVDDVSQVCDSKLAVQCNDNSVSWKSIGIYAHLDGEVDELLFACESIENGEYKDTTIVELPVTLDGVVADFGLSEGGSGGGGGEVPANMMTTDTSQTGLNCMKQWLYEEFTFNGSGSIDAPERYDRKTTSHATIGSPFGIYKEGLISVNSYPQYYDGRDWVSGHGSEATLTTLGSLRLNSGDTYDDVEHVFRSGESLTITPNGVQYNNPLPETLSATWSDIINATKIKQGFDHASVRQTGGDIHIGDVLIRPDSKEIEIGLYVILVIDSNSKIASVRATNGSVLDISAAVFDTGSTHRVSGIVNETAGLSFDAPITPAEGQEIYIHWTRYSV